jgi:2-polyprenyl-3-methyl-5-hydroxy-6-metoxy-1,4-benzoquinol methylase
MQIKTVKTETGVVAISRQASGLTLDFDLPDRTLTRQTTLPLEVVEYLIEHIGCAKLANALQRQSVVPGALKTQLLSYFTPDDFKGKRLLDFGSGFGTCTLSVADLLPDTEVIGVELDTSRTEIAGKIAAFQQINNVRFLCSPSGDRLPDGIGQFDFVMLNAVYEHMLPRERRGLMPLIWAVVKEGGTIFINHTPQRYFPYEHHSTGLWGINYLPDRLAHFMARRFAEPSLGDPGIARSDNWETHLRGGIRGGTERSVIRDLTAGRSSEARILQPLTGDRADYWFNNTGPRHKKLKKAIASVFRLSDRLFGIVPSMNINVVIQKKFSSAVKPL